MKILILSPHADDAEYGCGGLIADSIKKSLDVYVIVFSFWAESIPQGFDRDETKREFDTSMRILGIKKENQISFNFRVRHFLDRRQDILELLIEWKDIISPDIIFMPASTDIHQDHHVIYSEGLRAFKDRTIYGFEIFRNNINFNAQMYYQLDREALHLKIGALNSYHTQAVRIKGRPYEKAEFMEHVAKMRGAQVGMEYAECFEVIRKIGI